MAGKHPYVTTLSGLTKTLTHLRKSFPAIVTSDTLKKLNYAPNNETYIIYALRFLGLIDDDGNRSVDAAKDFNLHDDAAFNAALSKRIASAYVGLFDLHGDSAWTLDHDSLISYFRNTDSTTAIVGKRQASTFQALAQYIGHGAGTAPKASHSSGGSKAKKAAAKNAPAKKKMADPATTKPTNALDAQSKAVGLTVRIEINLPSDGDEEIYNNIFKSIRQNLMNG